MRSALLLLAILSAAGGGYIAWESGLVNPGAIGLIAVAVLALVAFQLGGPSDRASKPELRRQNQPREMREELSELAANIEALARGSGSPPDGVFLVSVGRNQIAVIKVLRTHLDLGLREAKEITDRAKSTGRAKVAAQLTQSAAEALARDIEAAGGAIEIESLTR